MPPGKWSHKGNQVANYPGCHISACASWLVYVTWRLGLFWLIQATHFGGVGAGNSATNAARPRSSSDKPQQSNPPNSAHVGKCSVLRRLPNAGPDPPARLRCAGAQQRRVGAGGTALVPPTRPPGHRHPTHPPACSGLLLHCHTLHAHIGHGWWRCTAHLPSFGRFFAHCPLFS